MVLPKDEREMEVPKRTKQSHVSSASIGILRKDMLVLASRKATINYI